METHDVQLERRSFIKGAAALGGAGILATLVGCAPKTEGDAKSSTSNVSDVQWDEEREFVVVGGGCGIFAALATAKAGIDVLLVEKGATYGGTTALSGNGMWAPNNWLMSSYMSGEDEYHTADTDDGLPGIVDYALAADVFNESDPDLVKDYVYNVSSAIKYLSDTFDIEFTIIGLNDYYDLAGAKAGGRAVGFAKDGASTGPNTLTTIIDPLVQQQSNLEIRLNTEATKLYRDESGVVVGIAINGKDGTKNIKASKGVLLNTGGYEHNEEMLKNYQRGPIIGCNSVTTNTGDGHKMAIEVGAKMANMSSCWGVPFYRTSPTATMNECLCDWLTWRYGDHSIIVNSAGKRFEDETAAYAPANLPYQSYDSKTYTLANIPAYHIGDQSFVSLYNYPGVAASDSDSAATAGASSETPDWVGVFDTLDELAAANGIDPEGLKEQIERWNAFCDAGVDEDFGRHANPWTDSPYFKHDEGSAHLGKIETPPFFCATIVPGTCGTNGGMKVNVDAQVLDMNDEVIPGLYASGNCSAAYFGSAYPGGGSTVGGGIFRALRAANHACDLGIF